MTQSKFIRRSIAITVILICLISWAALGSTIIFDVPKAVRITSVFAAAVSTEATLWVCAALLGWKALESLSIWTSFMRRKAEAEI